jgi:gamma-tubulin complex component 5
LINQLTDDILHRLKYLTHIEYIRDFFLFENGSLMHQFALRLYSKLSQTIHERLDAFTVLVSFDSTLSMFGIEKDKYPLNVIFQSSTDSSITQKYIIQNVQLKYDLPKELFIIIKSEQMEIYQKCFAFVLQVKQAKYVLDQLVFSGKKSVCIYCIKTRVRNHRLYRHQSYNLHHEMFLLRARLLHAVNAVNNFVLTTVCI